jgi:hypothetical protein
MWIWQGLMFRFGGTLHMVLAGLALGLVCSSAIAVVSLLMTPLWRAFWLPVLAVAILRARHCPSCGYSLEAIVAEADGCAACPECGAAWRLENGWEVPA